MKSIDFVVNEIIKASKNKLPFSLVRTNDGEKEVLSKEMFKYKKGWAYPYKGMADKPYLFVEENCYKEVWGQLRQSILKADYVGYSTQGWMGWAYRQAEIPHPLENSCYAWINHHLSTRKNFVEEILCKKKLFVAGKKARDWTKKILNKITKNYIVCDEICVPKNLEDLSKIKDVIKNTDFDIALLSIGIWADILCDYVKSLGKIGIDWGSTLENQVAGYYPFNLEYNNLQEYFKNNKTRSKILENGILPE